MGRQVAIGRAERGEALAKQPEVARLLTGHGDPVVVEPARQILVRKARDDVPGEVDGVELDMGERVQQRDTAGQRLCGAAPWHVARRPEFRVRRTRRPVGRRRAADVQRAGAPRRDRGGAQRLLVGRIGRHENIDGAGRERIRHHRSSRNGVR